MPDPRFEEVKEYVRSGIFGSQNYDELLGSLEGDEGFGRGDYFLVGKDFPSYIECQEKVDEAYRDQRVSIVWISDSNSRPQIYQRPMAIISININIFFRHYMFLHRTLVFMLLIPVNIGLMHRDGQECRS